MKPIKKVRVGFLSPNLDIGGAQRWMIQLAKHCDPVKIEWTGMALCEWSTEHPDMVTEMLRYIPVIYGPPIHNPDASHSHKVIRSGNSSVFGIRDICTRSDIVLTWDSRQLPVMTGNYVDDGLKVVLVAHSDGPAGIYSSMQPGATHFAGVSEASLNMFLNPPSTPVVIHNGAEPERCCPRRGRVSVRRDFGLSEDRKVIGYIGRLSPEKNPLASLLAMTVLGPEYYAIFVGPDEMNFEKEAERLPVKRDRYCICQPTQRVGDYLAMFDCLMHASSTEAFSLRTTEAWLAGLPVISTPIGHIPELEAKHGPLTIRVAYQYRFEPNALASAVKQALTDLHAYEIVERARDLAWNHYTAPACAERWTDYFYSLGPR